MQGEINFFDFLGIKKRAAEAAPWFVFNMSD